MLCRVVAAYCAIGECSGKCVWVGGVDEVGNVEGRGGVAVEDTD